MHYVYVLKNKKDQWYIGQTADLAKRVKAHKSLRPGYKLVYYEAYDKKEKAVDREIKLKHHGSAWRTLRQGIRA